MQDDIARAASLFMGGTPLLLIGYDSVPMAREVFTKIGIARWKEITFVADDIEFFGNGPWLIIDIDLFPKSDSRLKKLLSFKRGFIATAETDTTIAGFTKIRVKGKAPAIPSQPPADPAGNKFVFLKHAGKNVADTFSDFGDMEKAIDVLITAELARTPGVFKQVLKGLPEQDAGNLGAWHPEWI